MCTSFFSTQVKQQQGQKMLIEKSLEKKDQMESKKRESIMVVRGCPLTS